MIKVTNLSKSYSSQLLLDQVSFNINAQERIGLVGRNGHGKTTLLRLLLKQEEPDEGEIIIPKHYALGHLEQHLHFSQPTVLAEASRGLPHELQHETWRAEKILFGLGFTAPDMQRKPEEFSGGFQIRLNLAKVLVSEADLLLLDEPTNYLDVVSIRWLVKFLKAWKKEMILVTHDRNFMDQVTTHTMGIHRCKIRKISGSTAKLYHQLFQEEKIHEKTRLNEEKRQKEIELFISRFRAKARLASLVQSRIKTLEKTRKLEKLEKIESLDFSFNTKEFPAKVMLESHHLTFAYPDQPFPLIRNLNLVVHPGDCIGVIGKNGKGKSTLLKLLAGELQPLEGDIKTHPKLEIAYFGQTNVQRLHPEKTVEEELIASEPFNNRRQARNIAGAMMFPGDLALKKISVLSGGEKSRVLLGKLLLLPCHLLLLDEPTNHLDMDSCEVLLDAIQDFPGATVLVTHDELFLHTLPNKFVVFDRDRVFVYHGTYQSFLDEIGWENEESAKPLPASLAFYQPEAEDQQTDAASGSSLSPKELRQAKARLLQEKSRVLKPLAAKMQSLEKTIEHLELDHSQANQQLIEASMQGKAEAIAELPKKLRDLKQQRDFLYQELDQVTRAFEKQSAWFEAELSKLK